MTKNKTIIVFCLVFLFGFFTGKNLDRTIEAYQSYKRWDNICKSLDIMLGKDNHLEYIKNTLQK